jgi:hypothetical protein
MLPENLGQMMAKQTRVNVKSAVNSALIRRERRNGRDVIIVPSATLPDDIVMNRVRYPGAEIEKSYRSLNNTPAPLGHPSIEGMFVSASDPRGIVRGFVGAWNENARRENGRVYLDKVIDVEFASQLVGGKAVLEAIEKGQPIHTSTGLYAVMTPAQNDAAADMMASDIVFDHDAILIGEDGAATPEQGVGMMVNAKTPSGEPVTVINSSLSESADEALDWAVGEVVRALERREKVGVLERTKSAIMEALGLSERKETTMADDKQLDALSAKVDSLAAAVANALTGIQSLTDAQTAIVANQRAAEETERVGLVDKIVKANLMDADAAGELTLNAARALAKKAEPGVAAGLHNALAAPAKGAGYKLPKGD